MVDLVLDQLVPQIFYQGRNICDVIGGIEMVNHIWRDLDLVSYRLIGKRKGEICSSSSIHFQFGFLQAITRNIVRSQVLQISHIQGSKNLQSEQVSVGIRMQKDFESCCIFVRPNTTFSIIDTSTINWKAETA